MSKTAGQMTWLEAIRTVLQQSQEAMHYTDIAQAIIDQKLRQDVGATPPSTVNANITWYLRHQPDSAPFERISRGVYKLRSLPSPSLETALEAQVPPEAEEETIEESAGVIQAFGMFWRRDWVEWGSDMKLLGRLKATPTAVNFACQNGVYLLHDGPRVIYVGQVSGQRLASRLGDHTTDRLNGRWDRFSWFGIRRPTENGDLVDVDLKRFGASDIITAFEALLIEGLEPPQNRKRGNDFSAVEYLQVEDPALKNKQKAAWLAEMAAQAMR